MFSLNSIDARVVLLFCSAWTECDNEGAIGALWLPAELCDSVRSLLSAGWCKPDKPKLWTIVSSWHVVTSQQSPVLSYCPVFPCLSLFLWSLPEEESCGWRRPRSSRVRLSVPAAPPLPLSASSFLHFLPPAPGSQHYRSLGSLGVDAVCRKLSQVGFLNEWERKCSNKEQGRGCEF